MNTKLLDKHTQRQLAFYLPDLKSAKNLAELFSLFADTSRLRMLSALSISEMCVTDLAAALGSGMKALRTASGGSWGDHFHFRSFITPMIIKVTYILCVVAAVPVWLGFVAVAAKEGPKEAIVVFVVGLAVCVGFIFSIRLYCELFIVLFRIYEELRDLRAQKSHDR